MGVFKKRKHEDISYISGEFFDKSLEREYLWNEISGIIKYLRYTVLLSGVLYFLFIIPDAFVLKSRDTFMVILVNRIVFLLFLAVLYFKLKRIRNYLHVTYWITGYELLGSLFFLHSFYQYESPSLIIQSLGLILIILVFSIIPNRPMFTFIACLFLSCGFFVIVNLKIYPVNTSELAASIVYIFLVVILSNISSYRNNYLKRVQYINNKKLFKISTTDSLTGIYNRMKFDEELKMEINKVRRYGMPLSLTMFDIDDFKIINDSHGHLVGDKVLVDTIILVKEIIRKTDVLARWGGEEFMLLLPNTQEEDAVVLAHRIRTVVSDFVYEKGIKVTCSIGVTSFRKDDNEYTFVHRVDKLQYAAKQKGKNQVVSTLNKN